MFPIHVQYIAPGRYEVYSDDGRLSQEFPNRKEADIYADSLTLTGGNLEEAKKAVEAHRERRKAAKARATANYNARKAAMDSIGMKRNLDGSYE